MKLICGLGNPGPKYESTWHNVGFEICDRVAERIGVKFTTRRFASRFAKGNFAGEQVILLKPQTLMNRSGDAVSPAVGFYRLSPDQLLVIHDDADLPPGRLRFKRGGGTAGHRGLESIRQRLGSADFDRLRYGIGRSDNENVELSDFVLSPIPADERPLHQRRFDVAVGGVLMWLSEGIEAAMSECNGIDHNENE